MGEKVIKLILIGVGPHSQRIYLPSIKKLQQKWGVQLFLIVDLKEKELQIKDYLKRNEWNVEQFFIDRFENKLPKELKAELNNFVKKKGINGVIIATEPLAHKCYADWALDAGLNILMDKPITTRKNVTTDSTQAEGILEDYMSLLQKYEQLQKKKETIFSINVQRRYHPGFKIVLDKLREIANKTNCPITSIQSTHCDGQWRLPTEIVTQDYHPYNVGYGKASHSGYHIFDAIYSFFKASKVAGKEADEMEVVSSFVRPNGFLKQLSESDYERYFGDEYKTVKKYTDQELKKIYESYGEIDVSAMVSLLKDGDVVSNLSINLLHNGFARRNWVTPGSDLYKGNGRVKHEYHNIEQGPFQNIQIHSYQSNDDHGNTTKEDFELGGNNHFDIYIFRNIGVIGGVQPLEVIKINDIAKYYGIEDDKLIVEQTKARVIEEFLAYMLGVVDKRKLMSNIDDHLFPVTLMSSIYASHAKRLKKENPIFSSGVSI